MPRVRSLQIYKLALSFAAVFLVAVQPVAAQGQSPFVGGHVDSATLKAQEHAESLFESEDYGRAYYIYRHDLTPIGDKYAQYMVGFMILTGTGVNEDPVLASAWYRLSAERRNSQFIAVRDQLLGSLDEIGRARSDQLYLQLRREYSDVVILLRLIEEDMEAMTARTGSRLSGGGGPVTIVDPRGGSSVSGAQYFNQLKKRIEARLKAIAHIIGDDEILVDVEDVDMGELERKVRAWVSRI